MYPNKEPSRRGKWAAGIVALLFPTTPTITVTADIHFEELA